MKNLRTFEEIKTPVNEEQEAVGSPFEDALNDIRNAVNAYRKIETSKEGSDFLKTPMGKKVNAIFNKLHDIDNEIADLL